MGPTHLIFAGLFPIFWPLDGGKCRKLKDVGAVFRLVSLGVYGLGEAGPWSRGGAPLLEGWEAYELEVEHLGLTPGRRQFIMGNRKGFLVRKAWGNWALLPVVG